MRNIILILLLTCNLFAYEIFKGAEFYELGLVWIDVEPNIEYELGRTSELFFVVTFPRSGQFIIRIRSGKYDTVNEIERFSVWVESIDADVGMVDGEPMAWRVQKIIAAPTW